MASGRWRRADHAGFVLLMDGIDLSKYQVINGHHIALRERPYAATAWTNQKQDVDTWYRQRAGKSYEYIVRQIVVRANKRGKCYMVLVGTLDGRPRNVVMSAEYQHGGHSLKRVRELLAPIGGEQKVYDLRERLKIPCTAYSTKRIT